MAVEAIIEKELTAINDAVFQALCNSFISRKYGVVYHSPGTVTGKVKSKPGKPDAFFPLHNRKYIVAEYTTKDDGRPGDFFDKLQSDLKDCLDEDSLGIPLNKVDRVILCCNSVVTLAQYNALQELTAPYEIPLTIYGIQKMAEYLSLEGRAIAKEYLQVAVTAGSLLNRSGFVEQYQKGHIAIPLDTEWVGRPGRAEALADKIARNDMVIVKGFPGFGKTRLVLEAIDVFLDHHPDYKAFYLLRQVESIVEDLAINLQAGTNYVFFLDDGNKQIENLMQSIAQQAASRRSQIRIVTTVRDYAKADVMKCAGEMKLEEETVGPLDSDSMAYLIRQVCPDKAQQLVVDRILRISDGNPRLALMAATTIRDHPEMDILVDAASIFAGYFETIIDNNPILKQRAALKAMGLLAFFDTIDFDDPNDELILQKFGCNREEVWDIIYELEALEFVESFEGTVFRIAEQTMSTFFFYKVFIKEKVLPFSEIVTDYFATHAFQIRNAIIPANLIFGTGQVIDRIKDNLLTYYQNLSFGSPTQMQFLDVFGRYFPSEVFVYILKDLAVKEDVPGLLFGREVIGKNVGNYDHHPLLKLLEVQWETTQKGMLETAIDIVFRLVRKQPHLYGTVVRRMQQGFAVNPHQPSTMARQKILFEWMLARRTDEGVIRPAFYAVFGKLALGYHYDQECYRQQGQKVVLDECVAQLRVQFWEILIEEYPQYMSVSYKLLLQYIEDSQYYYRVLLKFDLPFFKRLILSRLRPEDFGSCYLVNFYHIVVREKRVRDEELNRIASAFDTPLWQLFLLYANDPFLRARERGDDLGYDKRAAARAGRIRQSVEQCTIKGYKERHQQLELMMAAECSAKYNFAWANDLILDEVAKNNPGEGLKALQYYSQKGSSFGAFPNHVLQVFFERGQEWADKVWQVIDKSLMTNKFKWMDHYFYLMPVHFINKRNLTRLLNNFQDTISGEWLYEKSLDKFEAIEPKIYQKVLQILFDKHEVDEKFIFRLGYHFFQTVAREKVSLELCKAAYLQQERMPGHFDNDSTEFFTLFDLDPSFLMDYSRYVTTACPMRFLSDYRPLGQIWGYVDAEELVRAVFEDLLVLNRQHYCREMVFSLFFGVKPEHLFRALAFLDTLISEFSDRDDLIDWVFEIARKYFRPHYMRLIVSYLRQNPDLKKFMHKDLLDNSFFTSTNEIWAEVRAKELRSIHSQLSDALDWITYKDHLDFINRWIRSEQEQASLTRKRRFRKQEF
jgi:hypothetical protein